MPATGEPTPVDESNPEEPVTAGAQSEVNQEEASDFFLEHQLEQLESLTTTKERLVLAPFEARSAQVKRLFTPI